MIFDKVSVKKYFVEIGGMGYPKGRFLVDYTENKYLKQYWNLTFFYKVYAGEQIPSPIIT